MAWLSYSKVSPAESPCCWHHFFDENGVDLDFEKKNENGSRHQSFFDEVWSGHLVKRLFLINDLDFIKTTILVYEIQKNGFGSRLRTRKD